MKEEWVSASSRSVLFLKLWSRISSTGLIQDAMSAYVIDGGDEEEVVVVVVRENV